MNVGLSNILDSELCRRKPTKRSHRKVVGTTIVDRKLLSEVLKRIEGVTAVSYTHLDVYKRQMVLLVI